MPRKLLLTHAAGRQEVLLDMVEPNYAAYAARNGYDFHAVRGPIDTAGRAAYWSKVAMIRELLPTVDILLWMDCDFVIRRLDLDMADEFFPDDFQTMCMEYHGNGPGPNMGLWMLRNVPEAHEFIDLLWETGDLPGAQLYEMSTVSHLLGFSYLPHFVKPVAPSKYLARTGWLDQRWNSVYLFQPEARWTAHAVHFAGIELADKVVHIRDQIARDRLPGWAELEGRDWVEMAQAPAFERFLHPDVPLPS